MRDAAGELSDGFHLVRLPERILGALTRLVLRLQFARALLDGFFQRLRETAQLGYGALAFGHIDADPNDADRPLRVVEDDSARLDPSQLSVARAHDAKLGVQIARARCKCGFRDIEEPRQVFAIDALEPRLIAAVEIRQPID